MLQVYRELLEAVEVTKEALRELQSSAVPIISLGDKAQVEQDVRNEVSVSPVGPCEMPGQLESWVLMFLKLAGYYLKYDLTHQSDGAI